jgi:hypothetical protein
MNAFLRSVSFKFLGAILIVGLFYVLLNVAQAATENVEVPANKTKLIDVISLYDRDSCRQMVSGEKVRTQAKNGSLFVKRENYKLPKGPCMGRTIKVVTVYYRPNKGFRGKDGGSVSCSHPPKHYRQRSVTQYHTHKYNITVK